MNPFFVPKVVKYFKSAVKSQRRKFQSTDCYFWLQYATGEKPLIYLQLDEGIWEPQQVESAKSLFNLYDEIEISGLEIAMKFNLDTEIAEMLLEVSILKKIDADMMKVCIHETDGIMVANTYNGDKEISCDTLESLLAPDTDEDNEADHAAETNEETETETENNETENNETETST